MLSSPEPSRPHDPTVLSAAPLVLTEPDRRILLEIADGQADISMPEETLTRLKMEDALTVFSEKRYTEMGTTIASGRSLTHLITKLRERDVQFGEELKAHEESAPSAEMLTSFSVEEARKATEGHTAARERILEARSRLGDEITQHESQRRQAESLRDLYDSLVPVTVEQEQGEPTKAYVTLTDRARSALFTS